MLSLGAPMVHASADDRRHDATRAYYDEFSRATRPSAGQPAGGYHALVDDLESASSSATARAKRCSSAAAATGLLLERFARFARTARGIDSLRDAREGARRGLDVREASVTRIPFDDGRFDVTCAFKVLAHVPEIGRALAGDGARHAPRRRRHRRVLQPGQPARLAKRLGPAGRVSAVAHEDDVYTRFDAPGIVPRLLPPSLRFARCGACGLSTPAAAAMRVPVVRDALRAIERRLAAHAGGVLRGFYVAILRKNPA